MGTIGWPAGPHLRLGARTERMDLGRSFLSTPSLHREGFSCRVLSLRLLRAVIDMRTVQCTTSSASTGRKSSPMICSPLRELTFRAQRFGRDDTQRLLS